MKMLERPGNTVQSHCFRTLAQIESLRLEINELKEEEKRIQREIRYIYFIVYFFYIVVTKLSSYVENE